MTGEHPETPPLILRIAFCGRTVRKVISSVKSAESHPSAQGRGNANQRWSSGDRPEVYKMSMARMPAGYRLTNF